MKARYSASPISHNGSASPEDLGVDFIGVVGFGGVFGGVGLGISIFGWLGFLLGDVPIIGSEGSSVPGGVITILLGG